MKNKWIWINRTGLASAVLLAAFLPGDANAQTPSFPWAKRVASTSNTDGELSIGMTLDSQGNVYVTGWFDGTNDFGGFTLTNVPGGGQDIFVAKYNSTGSLQWARRAGSNAADRDGGRGIGLDIAGNAYITGEFIGTADFGNFTLSAPMNKEFFLAKYDNAGSVQWVRQSVGGRSSGVYGTGLAVDGAGNSYAVGFADNGATITFGTINLLRNDTGYSTFLVKYDSAGTCQWAQLMGGPGHTYATKVAVDIVGNVYVRGAFTLNMTIGTSNLVSAGSEGNMFIAKFSNSGDLTWVAQAEGGNVDEGGVAVDQAGNVYVSGGFGGSPLDFGGIILTNVGSVDAFVAKYSSPGAIQWARQAGGGTNYNWYWDVALDTQGNIYAAGFLSPDVVAPGSGGAMVAKYDPAGTLQWAKSASGPAANLISSATTKCAVDSAGSCYLAGWYQTTTIFGTNVLQPQPQAYWNYFLAKVGFAPLTLGIAWSNSLPRLSVSGDIGTRFALEYMPELAAGNSWDSLVTNTLTSNPFFLTDTNSTGSSNRFYRARLVP